MKAHTLKFTGALIERGFWLYLWHVTCGHQAIVYVGRTGDSSSHNAAPPFNRIGQHLDVRPKASANMLLKHMRKRRLDPIRVVYQHISVGPIFAEQATLQLHRQHRDIVAAMEAALGTHMKSLGYDVVSNTASRHHLNEKLFAEVLGDLQPELALLPAPAQLLAA